MEIIKYSNIGCREINQDCLASLSFDHDKSIHIVADGIGGYDCGEIASKIVCESYIHGLVNNLSIDEVTKEVSKNIQTECRNLGVSKMGSTVAAVFLNGLQASIFWAGDSRVYVFRDKHLLYQTEDHSLVNSLVKLGKITPEEALTHPQRNVIIRAIQGTHTPTEADIITLNDIRPDDFLFLCTDGVLERLKNDKIAEIFNGRLSVPEIKDALMEACDGKTRDNFSFYIITIQIVEDSMGFKQNILSFLYSFI